MSRRLEGVTVATPAGALTDVITCPAAGHKYEVVDCLFGTDGSAAIPFLVGVTGPGRNAVIDEVTVASGSFGARSSYQGVVLYADESFIIFPLAGGSPALTVTLDYIDVEFD